MIFKQVPEESNNIQENSIFIDSVTGKNIVNLKSGYR